ncbi:MAG: ArsC/Spx/MgsR family protein [Myxococcota bacterium]
MSPIRLYHNPGCSKSRGALQLLEERGVEVQVIEYLNEPPGQKELEGILQTIEDEPSALVRHDKNFDGLGLDREAYTTPEAIVSLLLEHPHLMQRPVAIRQERGLIARPSERVLELLD